MGVYIKNLEMPKSCKQCIERGLRSAFRCLEWQHVSVENSNVLRAESCPLAEIPEKHGTLIDKENLRAAMYHEAFEADTDMQKWDGGCWIRYKMFENCVESAKPIVRAEK